jgi:predicted GH43/DUF377 family glycosyl hydrolase
LLGKYWIPNDRRIYNAPKLGEGYPRFLRENLSATGLLISSDLKKFTYAGLLSNPAYDDRDVIMFPEKIKGKYVTLHRPMEWCGKKYGTDYPAMWIAFSDDLLGWKILNFWQKASTAGKRKSAALLRLSKQKTVGWLFITRSAKINIIESARCCST